MTTIEGSSSQIRKNLGYTIDQTILIVAVIAILITLIIASVGWDLLNRTGGTKAASNLRQLEDAVGTFYARMGMWPDDANIQGGGETPEDNILVLQDPASLAGGAPRLINKHTNLLPSLIDQDGDGALDHNFGAGGAISMGRVDLAANNVTGTMTQGRYMVIAFDNMPLAEAEEADEAIDGEADYENGRVVVLDPLGAVPDPTGGDCDGVGNGHGGGDNLALVCYVANLVN